MDRGTSDKIKNILNQDFNFKINKIIGSYADFDKSYSRLYISVSGLPTTMQNKQFYMSSSS